jgi:serine/threonine protein kinase
VLGSGYQAIVRRLPSASGELVVKSPHPNPFLAWFGSRAIRREARTYERLAGIPGIPASFGLAGGKHLALEHIDGPTLRAAAGRLTDRVAFLGRLLETIRAMHAAGVAHGDLKRQENTLVGPGETPYVVDFGIACLRQGGALSRKRFELVRQMDLNAWIKLKYGTQLDGISAEDAAIHRPLLIERWARRARSPWKLLTLRPMRKRRREEASRRRP